MPKAKKPRTKERPHMKNGIYNNSRVPHTRALQRLIRQAENHESHPEGVAQQLRSRTGPSIKILASTIDHHTNKKPQVGDTVLHLGDNGVLYETRVDSPNQYGSLGGRGSKGTGSGGQTISPHARLMTRDELKTHLTKTKRVMSPAGFERRVPKNE